MSGHSKWHTIKHKKGAADAKRGKVFSKLAKYITVAARHGGGNPVDNLRLRYAIDKARAESMPKDSIDRAIKKGTGALQGQELVELTYEAIAPGGVSLIVEVLTDNRNRTGGEIRANGRTCGSGCAAAPCTSGCALTLESPIALPYYSFLVMSYGF